jgi:hypothetical protein
MRVLMKLYYDPGCIQCLDQLRLAEGFARSFPDQLILQKIPANQTSLIIMNYRERKILSNITRDEILDILCKLMARPPVECVMRRI